MCRPAVVVAGRVGGDGGELELYQHHVVPQAHCEVEGSLARQEVCHLHKTEGIINTRHNSLNAL